jgi:CheY-like chemotaxis protein
MEPTAKTILLVDDEQFITIAYRTGLEQAGYQVVVAQDGEAALMELQQTKPDLILLDLIMPKLNGFEVLQALRDNPELAAIPVIVLTNLSQPSDEAEARSYGVADFIVKADVSLGDVLDRIEQVLVS